MSYRMEISSVAEAEQTVHSFYCRKLRHLKKQDNGTRVYSELLNHCQKCLNVAL